MTKSRLQLVSVLLVAALLLLTACMPAGAPGAPAADSGDMAGDFVPVTYTYASRGVPTDLEAVQNALNEILHEKIGVHLTLEPIDFGAYNDKMQLRLAAGEPCDIIFTAPWINSYTNNVANGVLAELDDLLQTEAPGLWASMPDTEEAMTWLAPVATATAGEMPVKINSGVIRKPPPMPNMPARMPTAAPMPKIVNALTVISAIGR